MPVTVTHIIQELSRGGGARATIYLAKYSAKFADYRHQIISVNPADPQAIELAAESNIKVFSEPSAAELSSLLSESDIVQVSWWNNVELYKLFLNQLKEPCRLIGWFHVGGQAAPQVLTNNLVDYFDLSLACSPHTFSHPSIQSLPVSERDQRCGMVYGATDFERIGNVQPRVHNGFIVGYIGTIDFIKMHPSFVKMSIDCQVPEAQFLLCGHGEAVPAIIEQAKFYGKENAFRYAGYVENLPDLLSTIDVYGYPLREDTYAASEMNLQEVMYAGIPVVVLPSGGIKDLVIDGHTGIVARNEQEYSQAIKYLYDHPEERKRLGANAKAYAEKIFGADNAGKRINQYYEQILQQPKTSHLWRGPKTRDINSNILPAEELQTGHGLFIESLGAYGKEYLVSGYAENINDRILADSHIMNATEVMTKSGINAYRNAFPESWLLNYWQAIVFIKEKSYVQAAQSLINALQNACTDQRPAVVLAPLAKQLGEVSLTEQAVLLEEALKKQEIDVNARQDFLSLLGLLPQRPQRNAG